MVCGVFSDFGNCVVRLELSMCSSLCVVEDGMWSRLCECDGRTQNRCLSLGLCFEMLILLPIRWSDWIFPLDGVVAGVAVRSSLYG